jgi:FixJ family two-component response regulator
MASLIAVVDDDLSVRESLESLIRSVGLDVTLSASADEFLNSPQSRKADCLVFDVRLPGMSGIDLHRHLVAQRWDVPVIFMTAHGFDSRAKSAAASDWTVAYLTKPFTEDEFLGAVAAALTLRQNHTGTKTADPGGSHE